MKGTTTGQQSAPKKQSVQLEDRMQIWSNCSEATEQTYFKTGQFSQSLRLSLKRKFLLSLKTEQGLRQS
jgi:hypothetical protein